LAEILEALGLVDDALDQQRHIARRCIAANDDAGSEAALIHIIRLSPNALTARNMLAELQARRGDIDTAIITLEQVVTIALSGQQRDIALAALDRLTTLRSHPEDTRLAAEVLLERGEVGDAQLALAKLQVGYRLNPRDLRTLRLLVLAFDAVGQPRRGDEVLKEAARIARDSGARDTFARIIDVLQLRAPDDPSVTALLNG
jgi:ATP/maltotriose-dependent transcriptional regulator MalT